jgi:signal transduction histidine kinase
MAGARSGAWLGTAWAFVSLLAVLVATRWLGRAAGYAATATSAGLAVILLKLQAPGPIPAADWAAVAVHAVLGCGIAAWTRLRQREPVEPHRDPRLAKEEFLATVSHELRTPLNAILGWTELLRMPRGLPPQHVDRGLEVIERNARRQLALVDELLAAADPAPSSDAFDRLDLGALVRSLTDDLARPAADAQVSLRTDAQGVSGPSEPVWVDGDAAGLRVALRHVVENAIKFTPAGGHVRVQLRHAGSRVCLFVSDTGPGIDARFADRVFEPFLQEDGSATRAHGGLGLGLTVARKLIERHGGHLDLRSGGDGTTVLVTLPAREAGPAGTARLAGGAGPGVGSASRSPE